MDKLPENVVPLNRAKHQAIEINDQTMSDLPSDVLAWRIWDSLNGLAAQRLATASDEDLRRRRMVLQELYMNAASAAKACRGYQSARRPGSRLGGRIWKDRSSVNKAGEQKAQRDMSRALGERELIAEEIQRRADAQAARA